MFETTVDSAGAIHHLEYFSRIYWNALISNNIPKAYAMALAKPILIEVKIGFSLKYNIIIEDKTANGKE